jgi:alpha-N-acetylglucosaminidase
MIPLDLACDLSPVWRVHAPFRRKPWIYCTLHNFGQNTALFGNLAAYASGPIATLNDAAHGNMAGMGLTMEGIDQNAVVYELATDAMWRTSPIDVDGWIEQYLTCRYGACPAEIKAAWDVLRRVVYDGAGPSDISRYMTRPRADAGCEAGPELAELRGVVEAYLTCASQFGGHPLFLRDLVDIEKRYLAECGGPMLLEFWNAHDRGDDAGMARHSTRYLKLLLDIDLLVGTQEAYRMSNWVTAARAMGRDKAEADLMERNARMQVTVWGGPVLHDYAAKEWNGLIREFYAERWRQLFAAVRAAPKGAFDQAAWNRDIAAWEEAWTRETGVGESLATENAVSLAKRLLATYRDVESFAPADRGIAVGRPVTVSGGTEGSHRPEYAVDGSAGHRGRGWYASPYPQWLQVDLESPTRIGRVDLHTYWDGRRFYQYTIEVSTDGQAWTQVVDMSKNTRPAVGRGFSHTFPAALARFVRVNMLHNSANVGVHVTEMRVFAAS